MDFSFVNFYSLNDEDCFLHKERYFVYYASDRLDFERG